MARILHFVPAYNSTIADGHRAQVAKDVLTAEKHGHRMDFASMHSCDLIYARNRILHQALTNGYDYLYMQDADVYASGAISPVVQLIDVADQTGAAMTGALVSLRTRPPRANAHPVQINAVFEVEKLGTGMVLVVLDKVREWYGTFTGPCFARTYTKYEHEGQTFNPMREQEVGSDIFFCKVIRGHGQSIWCDSRIPTHHQDGTFTFDYFPDAVTDSAGLSETAQ